MMYLLVIEGEAARFLGHTFRLVIVVVLVTIVAFRRGFHRNNGLILLLIDE